MTVRNENIRMNAEMLPELDTQVALSGTAKQQEVGGAICAGIAAGIAIYLGTSGGS